MNERRSVEEVRGTPGPPLSFINYRVGGWTLIYLNSTSLMTILSHREVADHLNQHFDHRVR